MPGRTAQVRSQTKTKEELIKDVELHASEAHPDLNLQPEQVEALVKSSD
jgi:hypothetical protein